MFHSESVQSYDKTDNTPPLSFSHAIQCDREKSALDNWSVFTFLHIQP